MTRTHAYAGPSAAGRWLACPASVRLHMVAEQAGLVDDTVSTYAERGTYAMRVLEYMLTRKTPMAQAEAEAGAPPSDYGEEDREALLAAYRFLSAEVAKAAEWGVEARLEIAPEVGIFGTCDFYAVSDNVLHVVDYKHGAGIPVYAAGNPQLLLYAYGLLRDRPNVDTVRLTIIQPRTRGKDMVDSTEYDRDAIETFVEHAVEVLLFDRSPPVTGDHCRYCPAALVCPARVAEYRKVAEMTEESLADPENLRFIIAAEKRVGDLIEKAKRVALKRLQGGAEIAGLVLVEGPGRLVWRDGATDALRERFGDAAFETTAMSPARVRDTFGNTGAVFVAEWADRKPGYKAVRAVDTAPDA